jgi:hypothetical protein
VPNGVLDALIANPSIRLGACNLWRECSFTVGAMTAASLDRLDCGCHRATFGDPEGAEQAAA